MAEPELDSPEEGAARVFLSYSRKDRDRAQKIADTLRARHFGVFRDTDDILPTEEWKDRLQSLIEEADTIVFLLSPNSVHSEVCAWEVEYATSLNKRVAPIVIDDTEASDIPPLLARLNFIFCTERDPYENAINTLVSALNTDIDWIREHTRLAGLAQRWEAAGRPTRLLLRGEDIADAERWRDTHPPEAPEVTHQQSAFVAESRKAATRRQRLTVVLSLAALVVGLGLAAVAFWQREQAREQEALASEQRALAETQEARAVEERNQALIAQSHYLADIATEHVRDGDGTIAILAALEALPDAASSDAQRRSRPYVPEARAALVNAVLQRQEVHFFSVSANGAVNAEYSPDGARATTTGWDGEVQLWDTDTGGLIAVLDGYERAVRQAAFSPDGNLIATVADSGLPKLWDARTGKLIRTFPAEREGGTTIAFSPDGTRVLAGKGEMFDVATGERMFILTEERAEVWRAVFSPDGTEFITASTFWVQRWDALTGAYLSGTETINNFKAAIYSPDGTRILLSFGSGRLQVMDRESGEILSAMEGHEGEVTSASFLDQGEQVLSTSADGTVRIWSATSGDEIFTFRGHRGVVDMASSSPDGRLIASAGEDRTVRIWHRKTRRELVRLDGHSVHVIGAVWSPDSRFLLSWSYDGTARIWDWQRTAESRIVWTSDNSNALYQAAFTSDGSSLITSADGQAVVVKWDLETLRPTAFIEKGYMTALSPDGKLLAVDDRAVGSAIHDAETFERLHVLSAAGGTNIRTGPGFSPDGMRVVSEHSRALKLWDTATGNQVGTLSHDDQVQDKAFSVTGPDGNSDGRLIATASSDRSVRLWNTNTGKPVATLEGHEGPVHAVEIAPDASFVVSGAFDNTIRIWEPPWQTPTVTVLEGSRGGVKELDYDAATGVLASVATDRTVRMWDARERKLLGSYRPERGYPHRIMISPDGTQAATTWDDGIVRLHEVPTAQPTATYVGHTKEADGIDFSPDGSLLATTSWDGSARIWPVFSTTEALLDYARKVVPRCLTDLERTQLHLRPEPPEWCRKMGKWPHNGSE